MGVSPLIGLFIIGLLVLVWVDADGEKALKKLWIIKLGIILCFTPLVVFSASFTQNSPGEARDYLENFLIHRSSSLTQ